MKMNVGSKNQIKINAVQDAITLYPSLFPTPDVIGVDVMIDVFGHPKNIQTTVQGAIERAKSAFADCDYSFGLEGGLMEVPFTESGFMETSACAIYDGNTMYLGLSPAFEWPQQVTDLILKYEADASQAFNQLVLTSHEKLVAVKGGIIGV